MKSDAWYPHSATFLRHADSPLPTPKRNFELPPLGARTCHSGYHQEMSPLAGGGHNRILAMAGQWMQRRLAAYVQPSNQGDSQMGMAKADAIRPFSINVP